MATPLSLAHYNYLRFEMQWVLVQGLALLFHGLRSVHLFYVCSCKQKHRHLVGKADLHFCGKLLD